MRSRLLAFGPGGYPSHAYFAMPFQLCYIVKLHLTLIRFRASGVPISRNTHLMKKKKRVHLLATFATFPSLLGFQRVPRRTPVRTSVRPASAPKRSRICAERKLRETSGRKKHNNRTNILSIQIQHYLDLKFQSEHD